MPKYKYAFVYLAAKSLWTKFNDSKYFIPEAI